MKNLKVRNWSGRWYTSADELNAAAMAGFINRDIQETAYGANYTFTTKGGMLIATFYKDSILVFSSQAYSVQIQNTLVSQSPFFF